MSDESSEEVPEEGGKGGFGMMMVLIVALLCLGIGAGGAWFALGGMAGEAEVVEESEAEPEEPVDPGAEYRARLLTLDPFIVNVTGEGYPRFLKLKLELELDSPETKAELEARQAQVRDSTILLLSSRRLADIGEFEGKALLKDDLRARINEILTAGEVEAVLFTEFVVQ